MIRIVAIVSRTASSAAAFELTRPDLEPGGAIPRIHGFEGFGCVGQTISPALAWSGAPEGTASFATMVHDPDAPTGGAGFRHGILLDIPASAARQPQGVGSEGGEALPGDARQLRNHCGVSAWGGPCPPQGDAPHRHDFTLHALPVATPEAPDDATASLVSSIVNASATATATLQGRFGR